jgi:hypothetical protein
MFIHLFLEARLYYLFINWLISKFYLIKNVAMLVGVVIHTYNPSPSDTETGGS